MAFFWRTLWKLLELFATLPEDNKFQRESWEKAVSWRRPFSAHFGFRGEVWVGKVVGRGLMEVGESRLLEEDM